MLTDALNSKLSRVLLALLLALAALSVACGTSEPGTTATLDSSTTVADGMEPTPALTVTTTPAPTASSAPATPDPASTVQSPTSVERLSEQAWDRLVDLTDNLSPRTSGTDEEKVAAGRLRDVLLDMGYEAELQPFTYHTVETEAASIGGDPAQFRAIPLTFSARGNVEGPLEHVGLAQEGDVPEDGLAGKVALIERGIITFEEKVNRVADAGAVGAVIYNHSSGLYRGSLSTESAIPAVSVAGEDSVALLELARDPSAIFSLSIDDHEAPSQNVIAEKPGSAGRVVVLGAHYDTVPDSPGANDNGSGLATVLTVASELAGESLPFTLRLVLFGAEEEGLHGSIFYVDRLPSEEQDRIMAMLNFDALGSGPVSAVLGHADLARRVTDNGEQQGITVERRLSIGPFTSDHAPFENIGVPALFFLADDFSRINSPDDVIEFVEPRRMGEAAALAIGLLRSLAEEQ